MFCSKCGASVAEGAGFCSSCGQPVPATSAGQSGAGTISGGAMPAARYTVARPGVLYAGFWLRVVAAIIDGILLSIPLIPLYVMTFASLIPEMMRHQDNPFELMATIFPRIGFILLIYIIAAWLYWALMEASSWQATLGKKALGLMVTDLEGKRATFGRTSGRFFAGRGATIVPTIGGLYFLISCICAGFTEKKQAIHDMIAGCLVIRRS